MKTYLGEQLHRLAFATFQIYACISEEPDGQPLSKQAVQCVSATIGELLEAAEFLELHFTKKTIERFRERVAALDVKGVGEFLSELDSRLADELDSIVFLYLGASYRLYDQKAPFGDDVFNKFPSVEYDVREASNCLALDRYTACVMHSMRILECGLDSLAKALKVARSGSGWGKDLTIFKEKWGRILAANPRQRTWKRYLFPQLFIHFRYFADAWRNRAMHNHNVKYGEHDAQQVFEHVKDFMILLSSRFCEKRKQ